MYISSVKDPERSIFISSRPRLAPSPPPCPPPTLTVLTRRIDSDSVASDDKLVALFDARKQFEVAADHLPRRHHLPRASERASDETRERARVWGGARGRAAWKQVIISRRAVAGARQGKGVGVNGGESPCCSSFGEYLQHPSQRCIPSIL
jgi:hypothetical protein